MVIFPLISPYQRWNMGLIMQLYQLVMHGITLYPSLIGSMFHIMCFESIEKFLFFVFCCF